MSKSHVSMEQHACQICGKLFDTGAVLLDRRLQDSLEDKTVTGMGICPACDDLTSDGYIALIGCDPEKTTVSDSGTVNQDTAYRTGTIAHVRKEAADRIFGEQFAGDHPFVFVDEAVITMLQILEKGSADTEYLA